MKNFWYSFCEGFSDVFGGNFAALIGSLFGFLAMCVLVGALLMAIGFGVAVVLT